MTNDQLIKKPFEYMELKAMCMMCAANAAMIFSFPDKYKFKDEVEGRKFLEGEIEKIIAIRWDAPEKKAL